MAKHPEHGPQRGSSYHQQEKPTFTSPDKTAATIDNYRNNWQEQLSRHRTVFTSEVILSPENSDLVFVENDELDAMLVAQDFAHFESLEEANTWRTRLSTERVRLEQWEHTYRTRAAALDKKSDRLKRFDRHGSETKAFAKEKQFLSSSKQLISAKIAFIGAIQTATNTWINAHKPKQ